jgi:hypothetical protein
VVQGCSGSAFAQQQQGSFNPVLDSQSTTLNTSIDSKNTTQSLANPVIFYVDIVASATVTMVIDWDANLPQCSIGSTLVWNTHYWDDQTQSFPLLWTLISAWKFSDYTCRDLVRKDCVEYLGWWLGFELLPRWICIAYCPIHHTLHALNNPSCACWHVVPQLAS